MSLLPAVTHHAIIICTVPRLVRRAGKEDRGCNQYSTAEHWGEPPPPTAGPARWTISDSPPPPNPTPQDLKY
jgi:hypothetical protein